MILHLIRNVLLSILIVYMISCSGMTISDTKPIPSGFVQNATIILPFQPKKIRFCIFTNSFIVLDKLKNVLYRIDEKGKILQRIGEFGFDQGQFVHISDFAVDSFGNIFVVDDVANVVVQFDDFGQFVNSFTPMEMTEPELIAVQDTGELLIYDSFANQVFCFTKKNDIRFKFGKFYLDHPQKICTTLEVNYIADAGANTIFCFDSFGGLLHEVTPSNALVDITSTKNFYYYLDNETTLYVARRMSFEPRPLGKVADVINVTKPTAIIAFHSSIGVLEGNKLHVLQLIVN
ncbi:MAG: hypothetical protein J7M10_01415 [Candidatus Cloacimonetes bacterium]|nr:hypothetical protein [Candidatus Cloacimonadota bacterium]